MLTVEEIREKLGDRNLAEVARRTKLSYRAINHLVTDGGERPSQEMLKTLTEYLGEGE